MYGKKEYDDVRGIVEAVFQYITENIHNDIYAAYLKNEKYVYNVDQHLHLLCCIADMKNEDLKQDKRQRGYGEYHSEYDDGEYKVSDIGGYEPDDDEDAYLYYKFTDYGCRDYERTSYRKMRYRITEDIKYFYGQCYSMYQQKIESYGRDFKPSTEIEVLEIQKYMKETGHGFQNNNHSQPAVNKFSSTQDFMLDYLRTNEINYTVNDSGWINFNYDELHFMCYAEDFEDGYAQLTIILPDIFAVGSDELNDLRIINELNFECDVKFVVGKDKAIDIRASTWVDSTPEFEYLVPALIAIIIDARNKFNERIDNH